MKKETKITTTVAAATPVIETPALEVAEVQTPVAKENEENSEIIKPYLESYPNENEFYITSDGSVFLRGNAADANVHQKFLDPTQQVVVFTV